jgi:hypothetical protein
MAASNFVNYFWEVNLELVLKHHLAARTYGGLRFFIGFYNN